MENPAFTLELVLHTGAARHLELVLLPHQEEDPRKAPWFGVTLRCESEDLVLLRVRADNLYLCGYRSPDGRWWEFRGGSLIAGATLLSFTDSYGDMERVANMALETLALGKNELKAAARQLAATGSNAGSQKETAGPLMTLAVMVCEAIRFRSVGGTLGHMMMCNAAAPPCKLQAHMVEQVKNWRSLSEYWLGAVLYGQPFLPYIEADGIQQHNHIPLHLLAPMKIDCQDHAMMALGVALNRQRKLQDKHKAEMDEHRRALARKLDKARPSASGI